ncbi:MAG: CheR family methyltransferase [Brevinema sp.]
MEKFFTEEPILSKIKEIIYTESGIIFTPSYMKVLDQRVSRICKESGCEPKDILEYITKDIHYLREFVGHVTTNHTHFFRSIGQYRLLEDLILPQLVERNINSKSIRIWSAACSSGEEAFSLMMVVQNFFEKNHLADWTCSIFASDIDEVSLSKANRAEYNILCLKHIPEQYHKFLKLDVDFLPPHLREFFTVIPQLKENISFEYSNLIRDTPLGRFDIVFCRNVLIYFNIETQAQVVNNLKKTLTTGGYLFISPSETLNGISEGFDMKMTPNSAYYIKRG